LDEGFCWKTAGARGAEVGFDLVCGGGVGRKLRLVLTAGVAVAVPRCGAGLVGINVFCVRIGSDRSRWEANLPGEGLFFSTSLAVG